MAGNEQLVVQLEARIRDFEKSLARASGVAAKRTREIEGSFARTNAKLANFGSAAFSGFAKGALASIAPVLGLAAAVDSTKAALEQFGKIADQSAAAGVDAEFFQGIAHQAELAGVEVDGLAGAMAAFAKNSGLAAEGKGKMVSTLQALNPELLKGIQLATTQEQRFLLVADAISKSKDAAEQAAIAAAAFGDQGAKLVAVLKGGAGEIERLNASAKEMGIIVDRDLIAKADELGDKFETAVKIVDLRLKQALVNLAPALVATANWAAEFSRLLSIAADQLNTIENRQYLRPLQNQLAETYNQMQPVKDRIEEIEAALAGGGPNGMILKLDLADAKAKLADLEAQANAFLTRVQELQGYKPPATGGAGAVDPFAGMLGRRGPGRNKPAEPFYTTGGAGGGNDAAQSAIDKAQAVVDALKFEEEQLARTSAEQSVFNNLKAAGVTINSAFGQQIATATRELEAQKAALEANAAAMAMLRDIGSDVLHGFVDDLRSGKSAVEALGGAFQKLADRLLSMAVDAGIMAILNVLFPGAGSAAGGLGKIFGFADGGIAARGRPLPLKRFATGGVSRSAAIFGEAGPEAAVPLPDGRRIPVDLRGPSAANDNGGMTRIVVELSGDLEGRILAKAGGQTVELIDRRTPGIVKQVAPGAVAIANRNRLVG